MRKTKRPLTLLEIMIVIFLIGLIGSVIGYNMKGSIDEGRYFRTQQAANQIRDILLLEVAKGKSVQEVVSNPIAYLKHAKISKNPEKMLEDGWGKPFEIKAKGEDDISVHSKQAKDYLQKKGKILTDAKSPSSDAEDEN